MTRHHRLLLAATLAVFAISATAPVQADAPVAAGWWYRLQSNLSPVAIPAPPDAPDDGLYVALDPSGPLAEAAVSYAAAAAEGGTLTLTFASPPSGTPAIDACVATAAISGAQGGAWETKPGFDCDSGRAEGVLAPDGSSIVFTLSSAFVSPSETVDAVLIPTGSAPFTAPIEKPDDSSFVAAAPASSGGDPGFVPDSGTSFEPDPGTAFDDGGFGADPVQPGDALAGDVQTPDDTSADGGTGGGVITGGGTPVAGGPIVDEAVDQLPKIIAVVLLAMIGAAYWFLSNRAEPAPRLIGGLTGRTAEQPPEPPAALAPITLTAGGVDSGRKQHPVGGLGRFARPRDNLPNRL